jgi:GNAT superfamily N-acetyltransferase
VSEPGAILAREVVPDDTVGFGAWYAAWHAGSIDGRSSAMAPSLGELRESLSSPSPSKRRRAVAAFRGGECVGGLLYETPLASDLDVVQVDIAVPPTLRRQGVGACLWRWARDRAAIDGRAVVRSEVVVPVGTSSASWPGARFAQTRGFVVENVEEHLVADLPFDLRRLSPWLEGRTAPTGYRLESWVGPCPAAYELAWSRLRSVMSADAPSGGTTREAIVVGVEQLRVQEARLTSSWIMLSSLASTTAGDAVGYSTLLVPRTQPQQVLQDDTLVVAAHRGHGLGTFLKAANLRSLQVLPSVDVSQRRWLHTFTQVENVAMQRTNARFGFRVAELVHEVELRLG